MMSGVVHDAPLLAAVAWSRRGHRLASEPMPSRPPSLCPCGHRVPPGIKCACAAKRDRERKAKHDATRGTARQRGYTAEWEKASARFLARPENHFCACGCGRTADMVDHRIAHKGNRRLFWAESNWQAFNSLCNRRKAVREEGAFGRPKVDQGTRGAVENCRLSPDRAGECRAEPSTSEKRIYSYGA